MNRLTKVLLIIISTTMFILSGLTFEKKNKTLNIDSKALCDMIKLVEQSKEVCK